MVLWMGGCIGCIYPRSMKSIINIIIYYYYRVIIMDEGDIHWGIMDKWYCGSVDVKGGYCG